MKLERVAEPAAAATSPIEVLAALWLIVLAAAGGAWRVHRADPFALHGAPQAAAIALRPA
jgi:hypothetical protein